MKQDRVQQQAASAVVRAPILIVRDVAEWWKPRVVWRGEAIHALIAQDFAEKPEMCVPDVPPDPDDALIAWIMSLNHQPVDVGEMPTLAHQEAFYADDTVAVAHPLPALR